MNDIDTALVRLFSARYRNGDLAGLAQRKPNQTPVNAIDTPAHRDLALQAANKSLVLLKNDGTLPLKAGVKVAVIGPLADATRVLRGNYSSTQSAPPVSVVDGLRRVLPQARLTLVPAAASITDGDPVPTSALRTPDGKPGLRAEYINGTDTKPVLVRTEPGLESHALQFKDVADKHKVVWTGALVAPESGTYRLGVTGVKGELTVGGNNQSATYTAPSGPTSAKTGDIHSSVLATRLKPSPAVMPAPSGFTSISVMTFMVGSQTMAWPCRRGGSLADSMKLLPAAAG